MADRQVPLGHHLEHRRLHLRRRAVDLVGEHEVGDHGPELDVELLPPLPVDTRAEDVGGHEVRGELQARERAPHHLRHRLHRQGLRDTRHALQEEVAAGQEADEHPLDQPVLTDDHALDLEDDALEALPFARRARDGLLHAHAAHPTVRAVRRR
jgi:hypothetical protein